MIFFRGLIVPRKSGARIRRAPEGEITKRNSSNTGIFGYKKQLTRSDFRLKLKDAGRNIPEANKFTKQERENMEKELFPRSEYGEYIAPYEIGRRIKKAKKELFHSRDSQRKTKLRHEIDFLQKIKGSEDEL